MDLIWWKLTAFLLNMEKFVFETYETDDVYDVMNEEVRTTQPYKYLTNFF